MALNRMQNAKVAALQLLAESYTSRDQWCIVGEGLHGPVLVMSIDSGRVIDRD
ncbi:magnesium chelatase [Ranunculus cassubicifolius]